MSPDKSLQNLFNAALERSDAAERARFLEEACGSDTALRERVEKLLRAQKEVGAFMAQPSRKPAGLDLNPTARVVIPLTEKPGDLIGRYKLLQQIGEGGCGVVYMAEQEEPVRRRVALKVIKVGMDTKQVIARFEAERQALALMDHPNIAKVFDAGSTERPLTRPSDTLSPTGGEGRGEGDASLSAGRPYFVMELVRGTRITEFCDQKELPTPERLNLFLQVCSAVQHAHQKGIIHRDIKPSNILVTVVDGVPVPKVIDFGIAKATNNQPLTNKTVFTAFEQFIGTPAYMSPEQAELSGVDIDTRTDIYSLGVVLYELLTGSPPFDQKELLAAGLDEMRRIIRETEPPRPSNRLSTMAAAALTATAHQRHTAPPRLVHLVRGDLDWIVMKALEKDRSRRYDTANGFAMDVQRYLANEPVTACPPSTVYRLRKFVKRHKGAVAVAALVMFFLVLVGSGIGWAVQERSARQSRVTGQVELILTEVDQLQREQKWAEALAAARRAEAAVNSGEAGAETTRRVREQLKDLELVDRLERIRMQRSNWIDGKLEHAGAERDYARAFREYGVDTEVSPVGMSVERLKSRPALAIPLSAALDDWADAHWVVNQDAASAKRLVAVARGIDPEPLRDKARSTWGKSAPEVGDYLQRLVEGIDVRAQHPATLGILAGRLYRVKRPDAALRLMLNAQSVYPAEFRLNFELAQRLAERDDHEGAVRFYTAAVAIRPQAVPAHNNLGLALNAQGKRDEAIAAYHRAIELDPNYAFAYCNLGGALKDQKKLEEAMACYRKAIELDPKNAAPYHNLGILLHEELREYDQAIAAYRKAIELDPKHASAYCGLGQVLRVQKRFDEAIAAYRKAIELDPKDAGGYRSLGLTLSEQMKLEEARTAFVKAIEIDPNDAQSYTDLGIVLKNQNKLDDAVAAHRKAIEIDPKSGAAYNSLGAALYKQGKVDEEEAAYRKAIELDPKYALAYRNLGYLLALQNKLDEAVSAYRKAIELDPKKPVTYLDLGFALFKLEKRVEAIAAYRKAIELDPGYALAYGYLGAALKKEKKLDEAVAAYRKAIELKPDDAGYHNNLGALLCDGLRDYEGAAACFRKAIELDPKLTTAHSNLGYALFHQGKEREALAASSKAVAIDPQSAPAHRAIAFMLATASDARLRDPGQAVAHARKAVELDPMNPDFRDLLGVAFYRTGDWKAALATFEKARELYKSDDRTDWFFLAMAHWQLGNKAEARKWYDKSVEYMAKKGPTHAGLSRSREEAAELLGVNNDMPR